MDYFGMFPTMFYNMGSVNSPNVKQVVDITRRVKFKEIVTDDTVFYDDYLVQNGETPEMVSDKFYDSSFFHWVILVANNIVDVKTDWPMNEDVFDKYVVSKYGQENIGAPHHYVNGRGYVVDAGTLGAEAVSNYDYELSINNAKRRIKLVKPELLDSILEQFEETIQE